MKFVRMAFGAIGSLLVAGSVHAAATAGAGAHDLDAAQAALSAKDYRSAYARYRRLALERHNGLAQFMLGMFQQNGWGRRPDPVAACAWFDKAARQHVPGGEHAWGDCLAQGIGHAADIPAALGWYDLAASHGHLISWCTAADYYIEGKGMPKDVQKGLALCTKVALANSPPAMLKLAHYYQDGGAVPQDLAAARYWYDQAAQRDVPEAQFHLGVMLSQGEGGKPDLKTALFWLETAASNGYAPAYLPTAILYANAPVQAQTGALAPEYLAKIYLWTGAALARSSSPEERAQAEKIEAQVLTVMPAAWRPDLDKLVAAHLAKYPVQRQPEGL
jgi:hypothetical protein